MNRLALAAMGLVAAVVLVFFFAPSLLTRSSAYDQHVCVFCGVKKAEHVKKFGRMVSHRQVTLEPSAISRTIGVTNCQHNWLVYSYGHSFRRPFFGGACVDGGSPSTILELLLIDEEFAQELSRTANPSEIWPALVSALDSNRAFDEAFAVWWQESDHVGFSSWAASNGLPVKFAVR